MIRRFANPAHPRGRSATRSELSHFLTPLSGAVDWGGKHIMLCLICLALLYGGSGITTIAPNQVGLILRLGALVGDTTQDAVHGPGVLLALPRPFDTVVRVENSQIKSLEIDAVRQVAQDRPTDNFLLTADRNILHSAIQVRYMIDDPVAYALRQTGHTDMLRAAVLSAAVQETGSVRLDDLLGQERGRFLHATQQNAQLRANAMGTGLQIVSIEFSDLAPPVEVSEAFDAVQSANIAALTQIENARAYAARQMPEAQAEIARLRAETAAQADAWLRLARAEAAAFVDIAAAYRATPAVLVERLYREAIERTIAQSADVIFVPSPEGPGQGSVNVTIGGAMRVLPLGIANE